MASFRFQPSGAGPAPGTAASSLADHRCQRGGCSGWRLPRESKRGENLSNRVLLDISYTTYELIDFFS